MDKETLINKLDPDRIQCFLCKKYIVKRDSKWILSKVVCRDDKDCSDGRRNVQVIKAVAIERDRIVNEQLNEIIGKLDPDMVQCVRCGVYVNKHKTWINGTLGGRHVCYKCQEEYNNESKRIGRLVRSKQSSVSGM